MIETKSPPCVGVVDDDAAVRGSLVAVLESIGCRVDSYASAEDYLEQRTDTAVDFLIVDVRLPGMSGIELLDQLIAVEFTPPLIVMTGHADAEEILIENWPNEVCVLPKPCHPNRFIAVITKSLCS